MKRRSNEEERNRLEREAMAELQRQTSGPPPSAQRPSAGGRRAWGADVTPAWQRGPEAPTTEPEPQQTVPFEEDEEASWEEDDGEWEDDEGGEEGEPMGLLGIPLDYDATGIALQQLADRSNVRRPADYVVGVGALEAEQARDRAMAQFLQGQKVRQRKDAELAAARAAASPERTEPQPRAAFPSLSPGLSAKSLVMQPVAAPPLNVPKPAPKKAAPKKAAPKKAAAKKAVTKKAVTKKAVTKEVAAPRKAATKKPAAPEKAATKKTTARKVGTRQSKS